MSSPLSLENMNDGLRIVLEQWEEQGLFIMSTVKINWLRYMQQELLFDVLAMVGVGMMFIN